MHLRLSDVSQVELPGSPALTLAPRDAVLLAWLAVEGPTSRDRLAALLWPNSSDAQARTTLRQRLFKLKRQLGVDLVTGAQMLRLCDGVSHDLGEASELLGDLMVTDAAECSAWLVAQRERRRVREQDALREQAQALQAAGDLETALAVALSLLRQTPLSEAAHRHVMLLHYLLGDRAAALLAFDRCEQMLKDEVGARPSQETLALLETIERGARTAPNGRCLSLPASVQRPPRMIGRERESALLARAWASEHVVALTGEAGIGKSRLLQEHVEHHPGSVRAAARPGDAGVPFACLVRLLRVIDTAARGQWRAQLDDATRSELRRLLPEWGAAPAHEGQRASLQRALGRAVCQAPGLTGIVVDDLHFADDASVEMLHSLINVDTDGGSSGSPRWVLAFRRAEAGTALQRLRDALADGVRLQEVAVTALGEAALAELVDSLGLRPLEGSALAARLHRQTGGNPLFVLETLKQAWLEQRLGSHLAPVDVQLPRPMSVASLIERRLCQLSAPALALARVASVAGVDFDIALAESVLGESAAHFADALGELESAQVMRGTEFAHDLVQDAVRRGLPEAIAQHLHVGIAAWLEARPGEPARIAQHWMDAGQPNRAVPWLARAAEQARRNLSLRARLDFLQRIAEIEDSCGHAEPAFEAYLAAAAAHIDVDCEAEAGYARCDRLDSLASHPAQRVRAQLARATLANRRRDTEIAEIQVQKALAGAIALGDVSLVGECQVTAFDELVLQGRSADALQLAPACMAWVDSHAGPHRRGNFHAALAVLYDNTGQLDRALQHHRQAMGLAEATGNRLEVAIISNNIACNHVNAGRLWAAITMCDQALREFRLHDGGSTDRCPALMNLSECLIQTGQYDAALARVDEGSDLLGRFLPTLQPVAWCHLAACWWQLGQTARAQQALARIAEPRRAPLSAQVRRHRMRWLLAGGDAAAGFDELDAALSLLDGDKRPDLRLMLLIERAMLLPPDAALDELAAAGHAARQRQFGGHALEALLHAARIATGFDAGRAHRCALQALEMAREFDPVFSYRGEQWLYPALALRAAGDETRARAVLRQGRDWVHGVAQQHVPADFRDGFLQRQAVNRALLALAA